MQWYTAFPQIVSRVGHSNDFVYQLLSKLVALVIQEYPRQALWLFAAVVKSTKSNRQQRGLEILNQLRVLSSQHATSPCSDHLFERPIPEISNPSYQHLSMKAFP
jgi:hypothetical protein